jgi:mRNA interferase HigB
MWILTHQTLKQFWLRHADAKGPLKAWLVMLSEARWSGPADIKRVFRTASFVGHDRVVFNIGGNKYRLVTSVDYKMGRVYVRFLGTHAEYDKINVNEV